MVNFRRRATNAFRNWQEATRIVVTPDTKRRMIQFYELSIRVSYEIARMGGKDRLRQWENKRKRRARMRNAKTPGKDIPTPNVLPVH